MVLKAFAILDLKTSTFARPFFMHNTGEAVRAIGDSCDKGTESLLAKHPQDFVLYEIGSYDDATGLMQSNTKVTVVGPLSEFVTIAK